jgi:hypothetical protein
MNLNEFAAAVDAREHQSLKHAAAISNLSVNVAETRGLAQFDIDPSTGKFWVGPDSESPLYDADTGEAIE